MRFVLLEYFYNLAYVALAAYTTLDYLNTYGVIRILNFLEPCIILT